MDTKRNTPAHPVPLSRRKLGELLTFNTEANTDSNDASQILLEKDKCQVETLRSGLLSRPEEIVPCDLPVNNTIDPSSEVAAPTSRNNAFSPSFRNSKLFSRRETVYCRAHTASSDLMVGDHSKQKPPSSAKCSRSESTAWKISEQSLTQQRLRSSSVIGKAIHNSPYVSRKERNSVSFGSTLTDSEPKEKDKLVFDSDFECGNLERVEKILRQNPLSSAPSSASTSSPDFRLQALEEYLLYMEEEPNRNNGCQWFFFRVKNLNKRKRYSFYLCNFYKPKSSFTKGMRPVFFSCVANALDKKQGWKRIGDDISYKKNAPVPPSPSADTVSSENSQPQSSQYTLSFTFDIPYDNDICYFAFSVPYSYTRLQNQIEKWMLNDNTNKHLEVFRMCRTVAGNSCPLLRITDHCSDYIPLSVLPWERERAARKKQAHKEEELAKQQQQEENAKKAAAKKKQVIEEKKVFFVGKQKMHTSLGVMNWEEQLDKREEGSDGDWDIDSGNEDGAEKKAVEEENPQVNIDLASSEHCNCNEEQLSRSPHRSKKYKPVVVVSSRVHPGETVSSFMCEGLIQYLLSDSPSAIQLRERCVFIIVPMLNVDGVINGFYRTNLTGTDLNRCWDKPSELHHPTVFSLKSILSDLQKRDRIINYFDFHGHSHKKGIFFYGTRMYPSYATVYNQVVYGGYESPYAGIKVGSASREKFSEHPDIAFSSVAIAAWKPYQSVSPVDMVLSIGSATRMVNLKHCTAAFPRVSRFKGVARYVISEELEVPVSFTVEASFHCGIHGPYKKRHLRSEDYFRFVHLDCCHIMSLSYYVIVGLGVFLDFTSTN